MAHLEIANAVNKAVQEGNTEAVATLVKENYIQHTPVVTDGREGLVGLVRKIRNKELPAPVIKNIRSFIDGDHIILHHDVKWPNRKAMFEIFRMEDGLAAEHWSAIKRLLESKDITFNEVTWEVGYSDVSSFHKAFKSETGLTPSEYKRQFSIQ